MNFDLKIPGADGSYYCFPIKFKSNYERIYVENVCVIWLSKYHSHRYDFRAFFYKTKNICYRECLTTKKELISEIQNLLKENL